MSTREKAANLLSTADDSVVTYILQILQNAETENVPNAETLAAMEEADRIAYDKTRKRYSSAKELREECLC